MQADFASLTEIAGEEVSAEQVERLARRYFWAGEYCQDKDVLEAACGTGQGVGYLASKAKSMTAGDYSESLLQIARRHYNSRFTFEQFDAQQMPFADGVFDVVVVFEALYYIPDVSRLFSECRRILRPGGMLMIATANKDLFDFNPSPRSHRYLGVVELEMELGRHGFATEFWGDTPLERVSARQKMLRPVKALASRFGLIPKSMAGKRLLKRFVFGGLVKMPAEIESTTAPKNAPTRLKNGEPDRRHKVIFCAAQLRA